MNIVFMGTPDFAIPSLDILVKNNYNIVGVFTATDKPAGRGMKNQEPPIKKYALTKGLKVFQPEKLKSPDFVEELSSLKPDLVVVVAFRMLPEKVWKLPGYGTFNLHGSLLPQYRGAAPINRAIMNGEKETGVTTFFIDEKIDTGNILFYKKIKIGENTTAGELHDEMMFTGADLVLKTVRAVEKNEFKLIRQDEFTELGIELKAAPKISKEDCKIDWNKSTEEIHNHIRGLCPFPGAWTEMNDKEKDEKIHVKLYLTRKFQLEQTLMPGEIHTDHKSYIYVGTNGGAISLLDIQLQGKKRLPVDEFLRGFKDIRKYTFISS